jgi:hypothetical protein
MSVMNSRRFNRSPRIGTRHSQNGRNTRSLGF